MARGVNGYEDSKFLRNANRRRTSLRTRSVRHSNRRLVQEWLDIIEARGRAQDDAEANLTNAVQETDDKTLASSPSECEIRGYAARFVGTSRLLVRQSGSALIVHPDVRECRLLDARPTNGMQIR